MNTYIKNTLTIFLSFGLLLISYQIGWGLFSFLALVPLAMISMSSRSQLSHLMIAWVSSFFIYALYVYRLLPDILKLKAIEQTELTYIGSTLFTLWQVLPYAIFGFLLAKFNLFRQTGGVFISSAILVLLTYYHPSPLPLTLSVYQDIPAIFLQVLDIGGFPFFDFLLYVVNFSIAKTIMNIAIKPLKFRVISFVPALLCFAFLSSYGAWRIAELSKMEHVSEKSSVALVQTNFDSNISKKQELGTLSKLTKSVLLDEKPLIDLVIWPELPNPPRNGSLRFKETIKPLFLQKEFMLLVPSFNASVQRHPVTGHNYLYNGVSFIENGVEVATHFKSTLLPFVEYLPLEGVLPLMRDYFPKTSHYLAGKERKIVPLNNKVNIIPLICYESSSSKLVADYNNQGGNLMVNIVNDIWTLSEEYSYKHLRLASYRVIESRVPMVRVTNKGISAYIDSSGVIKPKNIVPYNTAIARKISVSTANGVSFYALYGDWFTSIMLIMLCIFVIHYKYNGY
jgi:apolipoprotein N-acyltransferase